MEPISLHLYLSPHLDDAVYSCGGLIYAQAAAGQPVTVMTLCAGSPDPDRLSPLAQGYHRDWGGGPDPMAARREEDRAALRILGASPLHLSTLDGIYRWHGDQPLYPERDLLFAGPDGREAEALPAAWQEEVESLGLDRLRTCIYAPLGVGGHVDHELPRRLGLRLLASGWRVRFYEDYPYVELAPGGAATAQGAFGQGAWQAEVARVDAEVKIAAMMGYRSQIGRVFGTGHDLVRRVKGFMAETSCAVDGRERLRRRLVGAGGPGERWWRRVLGYHAYAERTWSWHG